MRNCICSAFLSCIGLVLSTDLSSLIHPLSSIGEASLSWVNEYLTSITGIHLNYNPVVQEVPEDPPVYRRFHSMPRAAANPPQVPGSSSESREWGVKSWEYRNSSKGEGGEWR